MTDADKIAEGLQEAVRFASGDEPAERIRIHGHDYVPAVDLKATAKAIDRLRRLAKRRELEGIYTDSTLVEGAIEMFEDALSRADAAEARVKELEQDVADAAATLAYRARELGRSDKVIRRLQDSNSKMAEEWSAAIKRAVEEERERCAKIAEGYSTTAHHYWKPCITVAALIRGKSDADQ